MSEEPEFFTYTREEFLDEFVHPDDRPCPGGGAPEAGAAGPRRVPDRDAQEGPA